MMNFYEKIVKSKQQQLLDDLGYAIRHGNVSDVIMPIIMEMFRENGIDIPPNKWSELPYPYSVKPLEA